MAIGNLQRTKGSQPHRRRDGELSTILVASASHTGFLYKLGVGAGSQVALPLVNYLQSTYNNRDSQSRSMICAGALGTKGWSRPVDCVLHPVVLEDMQIEASAVFMIAAHAYVVSIKISTLIQSHMMSHVCPSGSTIGCEVSNLEAPSITAVFF